MFNPVALNYRGALHLALVILMVLVPFSSCSADTGRPNVVLIVVDAMRPDHLGCYGYERPTSPNIDLLAERSVVFETAITHAPWTKGSFSSIFTSLYPFQHGVTDWESVMPETLVTLPEMLSENGYNTMCVINMIGLAGRFGVLSGFKEIVEPEKKYRDANETTDIALQMMRESEEPFFLVVHYFDAHDPYRPPIQHLDMIRLDSDPNPLDRRATGAEKSDGVPSDENILREILMYDGCIHYVDEHIGRIVTTIDEMGIGSETMLIVTADHGEAFWEHGVSSHGANVYDEAIRVPLIMSYPDQYRTGKTVSGQACHVDLLPTIADVTGLKDTQHREGTRLAGLIDGKGKPRRGDTFLPSQATLCECTVRRAPGTKCIRTDRIKLIVEPLTSLVEAYDLRNDPGETLNMWGAGDDVPESMMKKMLEVPGVSLRGWRLAFTGGQKDARFLVEVSLQEGGHFSSIERFTRRQTLDITVSEDSASFHVESEPEGLDLLLFDTDPGDKPVVFEVNSVGGGSPQSANVGDSQNIHLGDAFTLTTGDAVGLPPAFRAARESSSTGVHVWWLSGEEIAQPGTVTDLTPEELKRLKALGYIQ
jgi:arylsulfatase A-like enzyme